MWGPEHKNEDCHMPSRNGGRESKRGVGQGRPASLAVSEDAITPSGSQDS